MDNSEERQTYEFAKALYLARQVDCDAAKMIVEAAEVGLIEIKRATEALKLLLRNRRRKIIH